MVVSSFEENINDLLQLIKRGENLRGRDCTKYIIIETKCKSGLHWPGENCDLKGSNRAQTYSLPVLDAGCDGGGGNGSGSGLGNGKPLGLGPNKHIGIPGSGSGVGTGNPSPNSSGKTFPNIPSGLSNTGKKTLTALLNYTPSPLHSKTTHLNYLKGISSFCFTTGALDLGKILYDYGINRNLSTQELSKVSEKAKEILAVFKKNSFRDFNSYTLADKKTIERNSLFISFLPDISILTEIWPKTQEEWAVLGDLFVQFLPDLVIGLIPGSSIIDVIKGFDKGDTVGIAFGIAGVIVDAFGGSIFRGLAKGAKVAYKVFTVFKLIRKFVKSVSYALKIGFKTKIVDNVVHLLDKLGNVVAKIKDNVVQITKKSKFSILKGGKGYDSFKAFKDANGSAGAGKAWHHIVEQGGHQGQNAVKFGNHNIHNTKNLIKLEHGAGTIHSKISGHYSSKPSFTNGKTVREWLNNKDFEFQYNYGIQKLKDFGWTGSI